MIRSTCEPQVKRHTEEASVLCTSQINESRSLNSLLEPRCNIVEKLLRAICQFLKILLEWYVTAGNKIHPATDNKLVQIACSIGNQADTVSTVCFVLFTSGGKPEARENKSVVRLVLTGTSIYEFH